MRADHRKRIVFGPENTSYRFQFGRPTATITTPDVYRFFCRICITCLYTESPPLGRLICRRGSRAGGESRRVYLKTPRNTKYYNMWCCVWHVRRIHGWSALQNLIKITIWCHRDHSLNIWYILSNDWLYWLIFGEEILLRRSH